MPWYKVTVGDFNFSSTMMVRGNDEEEVEEKSMQVLESRGVYSYPELEIEKVSNSTDVVILDYEGIDELSLGDL